MKEVAVAPGGKGDGDEGARSQQFVVCHNPDQADRDATVRSQLVAHLEQLMAGSDAWTERRRDEFVGSLKGKPGLRRYLRRTNGGLLRVDAAVIKRESHLDGKWLLRTSDSTLTPDDLAAAYKTLLQVERGWRDMKGALGLRPVFHQREDQICAHVQLCWLALLLIRVVENATDDTGATSVTNSNGCTWSPWLPPTGKSRNAPRPPQARRPSSPRSSSLSPPGSSTSPSPATNPPPPPRPGL